MAQNRTAAPTTLNVMSIQSDMPCAMAALPTGDIRPHMAQAPNMARCAFRFLSELSSMMNI